MAAIERGERPVKMLLGKIDRLAHFDDCRLTIFAAHDRLGFLPAAVVLGGERGGKLNRAERAMLQGMAASTGHTPTVAGNYVELAKILGVTRRALQNWRKRTAARGQWIP